MRIVLLIREKNSRFRSTFLCELLRDLQEHVWSFCEACYDANFCGVLVETVAFPASLKIDPFINIRNYI